MEAGKALTIV